LTLALTDGVICGNKARRRSRFPLRPACSPGWSSCLAPFAYASGVVDHGLVPEVSRALKRVAARRPNVTRYEENAKLDALVAHAQAEFGRPGVDATALSFVGGTLDGLERGLQAHLRPGDRVGVEDPAFPRLLDLLQALNLRAVPIAIDDEGLDPDQLDRALTRGLDALVVTPHGQNPSARR
jgi:DNA-binding transcriptional MocR family regulator